MKKCCYLKILLITLNYSFIFFNRIIYSSLARQIFYGKQFAFLNAYSNFNAICPNQILTSSTFSNAESETYFHLKHVSITLGFCISVYLVGSLVSFFLPSETLLYPNNYCTLPASGRKNNRLAIPFTIYY